MTLARTLFLLLACMVVYSSCTCSQTCVHGTCDSANTCICDQNWFGTNCTEFACNPNNNPCLNGATCSRGEGNDFICHCAEGYSGTLCDGNDGRIPITLCNYTSSTSCGNFGTCIVDPYTGNETCVCEFGRSGPNCNEVFNYCHAYPCYNGGTCVLTSGFFTCLCPPAFNLSSTCRERNPCNGTSPCLNEGTCYSVNGANACLCPPGFSGDICNVSLSNCDPSPCVNGGMCNNTSDFTDYTCSCPPSYSGKNCQNYTDPCDGFECLNGGVCDSSQLSDDGSTYATSCNCSAGFEGERCERDIDECTRFSPCLHGATCINQYDGYQCSCAPGYNGTRCENNINDCSPVNPCQNGGKCTDGLNSFTCDCSGTGFTGLTCNVSTNTTCSSLGCFFGGNCLFDSFSNRDKCSCPEGYYGELCLFKVQTCFLTKSCSVSGTSHCSQNNDCICKTGYTGPTCNTTDPCATNQTSDPSCSCPPKLTPGECCSDCANGGTCLYLDGRKTCICPLGWGGPDCTLDVDECSTNPCQNGVCINTDGNYTCTCASGYIGRNCEEYNGSCTNSTCDNGGVCRETGEGPKCVCPHANCSSLANNSICDLHCFTPACGYDSSDCTFNGNRTTSIWSQCPFTDCRSSYKDGVCDQKCNNAPCLYDGNDCLFSLPSCPQQNITRCSGLVGNGVCDLYCNTTQCPFDTVDCAKQVYLPGTLIMILFSLPSVQFDHSHIEPFRRSLGRLINAEVEVLSYSNISKEEASMYIDNTRIDAPLSYWKVTMLINIQYCVQACPTSIEQVIRIVRASSGSVKLDDFGIVDAIEGSPPLPTSSPTTPPNNPASATSIIVIIVSVSVSILIVVLVVGVLGKRVRDNGGVGKVLKKVRSRGIWHVDGRDQTNNSGSNTQDTTDLDRRSSSPECVADSFSQTDRRGYYIWQPIKVSVDGEESGSVAVIGERGKDLRRWTPLHCEAVRFSGDNTLQDILMRDHSQLDAQGPGGFTPLMIAIVSQEKKNRHKLITVRTDSSSSSSDQSERDILMTNCAPSYSHPGAVDGMILPGHYPGHHPPHISPYSPVGILVSHCANVNITNDYGQTALHLAAKLGREDYIHILLSAKADPNIQDMWGQTALHVAIGAATPGAFKALLAYPKTSMELKSMGGVTPLIMCVKMANHPMLQQLITKNVDIAATDNEGRTAVHWAAMINNIEALKMLIKQGPDNIKDAPNGRGETALYLACREGATECVRYLLFECFANNTLMDMLDKSPLQIAYERQHADVVELLKQANQASCAMPIPPPPSSYNHKVHVSSANPMFSRANTIKMEPGLPSPHIPPSYQQSLASNLPIGMPYPLPPRNGLYPLRLLPPTTTNQGVPPMQHSDQEGGGGGPGIPRVSSIEAELEQLVSLAFTYPSPISHTTSPATQGISSFEQTSPGHSTPGEGVSPGLSHHQDYSPASSNSPSVYPVSNQTTPPASHVTTPPASHLGGAGSQPLKHLPLSTGYSQDYQPNSVSSVDQLSYNTALQSITHAHLPGGHSPPIAPMTSPDPLSLPLASSSQPNGLSPGGQGTSFTTKENHSPSTGYQCFPSPPKEVGEYCYPKPHTVDPTADIINSLTPSPEDYSSQQTSVETSSPSQYLPQHQSTVLRHYAYDYSAATYNPAQLCEGEYHQQHLPGISVSYNAHESTV
ncbi:neurogenic locus notch homolog precursor [Amphimedon queenslandica]|uniref:Notch n=1 Tax=Amphimedon queenslandica TaxID=400682 RepID=B4Y0U8_AMPQE|nr:neurogenic locus notch homolog precursor [Amphimedon queenslandica]ABZ79675.1 notch [Amphimedon queenslandica]|eukprot:NP_001266228.1 neurogenic locus notch homolog precursor [Amphimedon queenslandica]